MAKKSKKVEKETRRLMEGIADLVKKKGDRYKFKSKNKKLVKKVKKTCVHWIIRKGKEVPTVIHDPEHPGNWKCTICGASFPIKPITAEEYKQSSEEMLALVNQMQFWSVKLGGDADDTKMFIRLKESIPRFEKVSKQILKRVNQREVWERNREQSDVMSQFDAYSSFNYRA
jgi:hypothetical protein